MLPKLRPVALPLTLMLTLFVPLAWFAMQNDATTPAGPAPEPIRTEQPPVPHADT